MEVLWLPLQPDHRTRDWGSQAQWCNLSLLEGVSRRFLQLKSAEAKPTSSPPLLYHSPWSLDKGALAKRWFMHVVARNKTYSVHTKSSSSLLVLLPFVVQHRFWSLWNDGDQKCRCKAVPLLPEATLKWWQWVTLLQNASSVARGKGTLGGRYRHWRCSSFVKMIKQVQK